MCSTCLSCCRRGVSDPGGAVRYPGVRPPRPVLRRDVRPPDPLTWLPRSRKSLLINDFQRRGPMSALRGEDVRPRVLDPARRGADMSRTHADIVGRLGILRLEGLQVVGGRRSMCISLQKTPDANRRRARPPHAASEIAHGRPENQVEFLSRRDVRGPSLRAPIRWLRLRRPQGLIPKIARTTRNAIPQIPTVISE